MTKIEAHRRLSAVNGNIAFLADAVFGYSNSARRLKTMVKLIDSGHQISTGHTLYHICIDGSIHDISVLDQYA